MDEHEIALNDAYEEIRGCRRDFEQHESYNAARPTPNYESKLIDGFGLDRDESRLERAVRTARQVGLPWDRVAQALEMSEPDAQRQFGYVDHGGPAAEALESAVAAAVGPHAQDDGAPPADPEARAAAEALAQIVRLNTQMQRVDVRYEQGQGWGRHPAAMGQPYRFRVEQAQADLDRAVADAILAGASWAAIAEALSMPEPEARRLYG